MKKNVTRMNRLICSCCRLVKGECDALGPWLRILTCRPAYINQVSTCAVGSKLHSRQMSQRCTQLLTCRYLPVATCFFYSSVFHRGGMIVSGVGDIVLLARRCTAVAKESRSHKIRNREKEGGGW